MKSTSLYKDLVYKTDKPAISLLFESPFSKEIRIAMKAGQLMKEHQTAFPIIVQIVEGRIDFGVQGTVHQLEKGDLLTLEASIPHDLKAIEDSIIRLTLSKFDKKERVEEVLKR